MVLEQPPRRSKRRRGRRVGNTDARASPTTGASTRLKCHRRRSRRFVAPVIPAAGLVSAAPVNLTATHRNRLLMGLAERTDLIVDFTDVPVGAHVLGNVGPDEPYGGGEPFDDFEVTDPNTGQIVQFRVAHLNQSTPRTRHNS